jgi:hypothetical protein
MSDCIRFKFVEPFCNGIAKEISECLFYKNVKNVVIFNEMSSSLRIRNKYGSVTAIITMTQPKTYALEAGLQIKPGASLVRIFS